MSRRPKPHLVLVDAPPGPALDHIVSSALPSLATCTVVTLRLGSAREQAQRAERLRALGPVTTVDRPDQVIDEILRITARGRPVDGVLALSELVTYHAAVAAAALGLPANPPAAAARLRRKDLQRQALRDAGIACPSFAVVSDEPELRRAAADLEFPVVLKPAVGIGSLCVTWAEDHDQLVAAFRRGVELYARDPRVAGELAVFVVESALRGWNWHGDDRMGTRVSVESLLVDGAVRHLAVTDKMPLVPPFREVGDVMPSGLPERRLGEIREMTTDVLRAIGATSGATHTELMLTASGPVVIEVNGRVGGGIVELMGTGFGYDVVRQLGRVALGLHPDRLPEFDGHAFFYTPQPPRGEFEILEIGGEAEIAGIPGVLEALRCKAPGDRLADVQGTAYLFRILAKSADFADFFAQLKAIEDAITLELSPVGAAAARPTGSRVAVS